MHYYGKPFRKSTGFTLIELLVVVMIISLLASILFPVFARARENARRASCMSNLKQIGLGVRMYAQDYDEKYPPGWENRLIDGEYERFYWTLFVSPYTSHYSKRTQLYRCPSSWLKLNSDQSDFEYGNYSASEEIFPRYAGLPLAAMVSPATTYMIFDGGKVTMTIKDVKQPDGDVPAYLPGSASYVSNPPSNSNADWRHGYIELYDDFVSGRHFGGVNMLFADGHVKWLQSQVVVQEAKEGAEGLFGIENEG